MAYTLSRLKDDGLNNTTNAEMNGDFGRGMGARSAGPTSSGWLIRNIRYPVVVWQIRFSPLFRLWHLGGVQPRSGIGIDRNLDDLSTDRLRFTGNIQRHNIQEARFDLPSDALLTQFAFSR